MYIVQSQDRIFVKTKHRWFVWEPAWDMVRPIQAVWWTGTQFQIVDTQYRQDPTSPWYGFGDEQTYAFCKALRVDTTKAVTVDTPEIGPLTWVRDRRVCWSPCASPQTWKRMCHGRHRTCRRGRADVFTRRNRIST